MFCSCTAFLAWALKLTASNVLFKCALLPRITVGTKAENRPLLGDFYKVYQNVLWNGTKIQTFRRRSLFLSGLKSCMNSIFQIFLKHFFSTSWVNILFCTTQAVGMSWVAKLSLLSPEGKVETNFKVFKGIFRERRLINKESKSVITLALWKVSQIAVFLSNVSWKWARWFRHSIIHSLHYLVPSFTEYLWAIYDRWRKLWSVTLGAFQWRSVPLPLELMKETAAETHLRLDNFTDSTKKGTF